LQLNIHYINKLRLKMSEIGLDLKELRERLKKTQRGMADVLGISQSQYSKYEKDPSSLSFGLFQKLSPYIGNLNELRTLQKIQVVDPGHPYQQFSQKLKYLFEYIDKLPRHEDAVTPEAFTSDKLKETIFNVARKPNIGLYGEFDSGKTHLLNCLLGQNKFNTNYRPTTSLITCIRHVDDKPEWLNESVAIMNKSFNLSRDYANSEEAWNKQCLYKGNIAVLDEFGVHQAPHIGDKPDWLKEAYYAVVYFDSPILRSCNILDTPGFSSSIKEDIEKANTARNSIDILLFLTTVTGSFNQRDFIELSSLFDQLPRPDIESDKIERLSNLYFVITHASVDNIKDHQFNHLVESASSEIVSYFSNIFTKKDQELIKQRMFPFWSELPERRDPLFFDITNLLSASMPLFIEEKTKKTINELKSYGSSCFEKQVFEWKKLIKNQSDAKVAYEELIRLKAENLMKLASKLEQVKKIIEDTASEAKNNFEYRYDDIMNIENISSLLNEVYGDDSKKARDKGCGLVNQRLQQAMAYEVSQGSDKVVNEINEFVEHFPLTEGASNSISIEMPFDSKGAFWGAVTSGVIGSGLMLAAASAGNLGGYAVAATTIGWLSSAGVAFSATGGSAGVMSIISAIGGPVTIGLALAALGGMLAWRLVGDNWEVRLSKKIIKSFEAENVKTEMSSKIEEFFHGQVLRFEESYDQLQTDYEDYLIKLRDIGNGEMSVEEIENKIKDADEKKSFFENNSWDGI
jgi:transcriptional regulator with XRE-family HTH domain